MKIRNGFISNSSSTSFIIGLPKFPNEMTLEDVHYMLFGKHPAAYQDHDCIYIAHSVYSQLQKISHILNEDDIIEEINNGYFEGYPEYQYSEIYTLSSKLEQQFRYKYGKDIRKDSSTPEYQEWRNAFYAEIDNENKKVYSAAQQLWNKYKPLFEKKYVVVISYSDNDGEFNSQMEHGGFLDSNERMPVIPVSHH